MGLGSSLGKAVKKITKSLSKITDPVTTVVGNTLNNLTGVTGQMDKSYQQQIGAMNQQNAYNEYMWNLQNQYNTPEAQLARMKEAGIDVNPTAYALGSGNLSNTAGSLSSAGGFAGSGSPAGNPVSMALGVASTVANYKNTMAQTANMQKQNKNLDGVIRSTQLENAIRQHNLKYAQQHGTPVGSMPGLGNSFASYANEVIAGTRAGGYLSEDKFMSKFGNFIKNAIFH